MTYLLAVRLSRLCQNCPYLPSEDRLALAFERHGVAIGTSVLRMLIDSHPALAFRWRYLPRITPWLLRFACAGRTAELERTSVACAA